MTTSGINSGPQGHVVSGSGNIKQALDAICTYNNGYNSLQAGLTGLLATLSTASAKITEAFQDGQNKPGIPGDYSKGGYLWQISHVLLNPTDAQKAAGYVEFTGGDASAYSAWMGSMQSQYQAASAANSAQTKAIDTQSSQVQNVMSQLPQSSQNNIQLMGSIVSWTQNLSKNLSN
jgi:hypothetical protein